MLGVAFSYCYPECHYAECHYTERCYGGVIMLNVIVLIVVMLNVIMLNVVASSNQALALSHCHRQGWTQTLGLLQLDQPEAIFLVMCDPSMNKL
jgi:hypothetical protein